MRTRVVVVDDDDISRRGLGELLADHPEIEVTDVLSHDAAMTWNGDWSATDVVIVDAADERRTDDQFAGVGVVQHVRRMTPGTDVLIIVITGHFFDDAVRRRMREAQADFFYHRSEVQEADALYAAVLCPGAARSGVPGVTDPEALFRLGIVDSSRVNDGVRAAASLGLDQPHPPGARSRSRTRLRQIFNQSARLNPINRDGSAPDRGQDDPSFPQVERFLEWATRAKRNPPPP